MNQCEFYLIIQVNKKEAGKKDFFSKTSGILRLSDGFHNQTRNTIISWSHKCFISGNNKDHVFPPAAQIVTWNLHAKASVSLFFFFTPLPLWFQRAILHLREVFQDVYLTARCSLPCLAGRLLVGNFWCRSKKRETVVLSKTACDECYGTHCPFPPSSVCLLICGRIELLLHRFFLVVNVTQNVYFID